MVVDELPDELVQRMVETGTRWVPTLELWQNVSRKYPVNYGEVRLLAVNIFNLLLYLPNKII